MGGCLTTLGLCYATTMPTRGASCKASASGPGSLIPLTNLDLKLPQPTSRIDTAIASPSAKIRGHGTRRAKGMPACSSRANDSGILLARASCSQVRGHQA